MLENDDEAEESEDFSDDEDESIQQIEIGGNKRSKKEEAFGDYGDDED